MVWCLSRSEALANFSAMVSIRSSNRLSITLAFKCTRRKDSGSAAGVVHFDLGSNKPWN